MSRTFEDITEAEIKIFKSDIEGIRTSTKLTMPEKSARIIVRIKDLFVDFSYLDLFDVLKESKIKGNSRVLYGYLYETALEELLQEKIESLSIKEIDDILEHIEDEELNVEKSIEREKGRLLTPEEVAEKSRKLSEEDLNYKRLAVAAKEGTLTDDQREVFYNEGIKTDIISKEKTKSLLENFVKKVKEEKSLKEGNKPKKV